MTDPRILLSEEQVVVVREHARAYLAAIREAVKEVLPDPPAAHLMMASVAVQAAIGELGTPETDTAMLMAGAGEGIGMLLGFVPDPAYRAQLTAIVAQSINGGLQATVAIHQPQGNA